MYGKIQTCQFKTSKEKPFMGFYQTGRKYDRTIPSWTGFNIKVNQNVSVTQDVISYLPTINAPATDMSAVRYMLLKSVEIKDALHIQDIVDP